MTDPIIVTVDPPVTVTVTVDPPPVVEVAVTTGVPVPGPPGPARASLVYHLTAVSSWTQEHNLAYPPMVYLVDLSGVLVLISAEYPDPQHVFVTFPAPFTGTIILS